MSKPRYKNKKELQENMEDTPANGHLSASTCITHLILAGTSAWTLKYCNAEYPFSFASYIMLFGHSLIGAAYYGHPQPCDSVRKICKISTILVESCSVPFLTSQLLLLKNGYGNMPNLLCIPALTAAIPIVWSFFKGDSFHIMIDIIVGFNLCVLLYLAVQYDSPWAYGLFTLGVLNQYVFSQICEKYEVPRMDLIAVGLTFFCIFSINTLYDAII
ncbi:uncharacterized protein LOC129605568 [Condylostylus longicornis]|uniref:uncharacterized protein LOC129605568 n=1 Tax=Condylostylus longicornis TaxID=2530218 RepID=UPI00244E163D|nr:uncharacterized protein LOC129605568 [Condylostylus longicornis]